MEADDGCPHDLLAMSLKMQSGLYDTRSHGMRHGETLKRLHCSSIPRKSHQSEQYPNEPDIAQMYESQYVGRG